MTAYVTSFLAGAAGASLLFAATTGFRITINGEHLNAALFFAALLAWGGIALVAACEKFSRHVEAGLASWRAAKAAAGVAWASQQVIERERLGLEEAKG